MEMGRKYGTGRGLAAVMFVSRQEKLYLSSLARGRKVSFSALLRQLVFSKGEIAPSVRQNNENTQALMLLRDIERLIKALETLLKSQN